MTGWDPGTDGGTRWTITTMLREDGLDIEECHVFLSKEAALAFAREHGPSRPHIRRIVRHDIVRKVEISTNPPGPDGAPHDPARVAALVREAIAKVGSGPVASYVPGPTGRAGANVAFPVSVTLDITVNGEPLDAPVSDRERAQVTSLGEFLSSPVKPRKF